MESMREMQLEKYVKQLASDASIPGGGSASAVVATLAASLAGMISKVTADKAKTDEERELIQKFIPRAKNLRTMLLDCVNEDAKAFEELMHAYHLPKNSEGRTEKLQRALKNAAAVPSKMVGMCAKVIDLHVDIAEYVYDLGLSDVGTGIVLAWGAMNGACLNVKINTNMMNDREYANQVNKQTDAILAKYQPVVETSFNKINNKMNDVAKLKFAKK